MSSIPGLMLAEAARISPDAFDHDTCVCGLAIIRSKDEPQTGWYHAMGDRGCKAALYDVDKEAWFNSQSRSNARPAKRSRALTPQTPAAPVGDTYRGFALSSVSR